MTKDSDIIMSYKAGLSEARSDPAKLNAAVLYTVLYNLECIDDFLASIFRVNGVIARSSCGK